MYGMFRINNEVVVTNADYDDDEKEKKTLIMKKNADKATALVQHYQTVSSDEGYSQAFIARKILKQLPLSAKQELTYTINHGLKVPCLTNGMRPQLYRSSKPINLKTPQPHIDRSLLPQHSQKKCKSKY
ncbi:hypothetical protein DPMN_174129 [Dreissena polymorpha]|uniref:Uncharacterized protein n=1 Tax=Dreissena polymorpha TaxID=45954 RepID=A0A9D4E4U3_DREPO|nr:hypothetical protein DPMN_174129 [Dreissena polymorpha]